MMKFTEGDIKKLRRGIYRWYTKDECRCILNGITGARGKFLYEVEDSLQEFIDNLANDIDYVTEKERWSSVEDAKKAYAWHILMTKI